MPNSLSPRRERMILTGIFIVFLILHGWMVTRNWSVGFMAGHEFRQTQTALISHYIDRNNDFGLLYEQPILGKPWIGLLLEVPAYEWAVVLTKRATGWTLVESARAVTLASFYLTLPALFLLLARLGLNAGRRLLTLVPVLCCPVYVFYSRAFLMDATALLASVWFLWAYLEMMDRQRWIWFVLASLAGTAAALIKSATFAIWLLPAAAYSAWQLWRNWRTKAGWGAFFHTVFWGLAGVVIPLGMLKLWIDLTDPIKAAHASAWIFTSKNLSEGNWGLVDFAARFSPKVWGVLSQRWNEAIMPPWALLLTLVVAIVGLKRWRLRIAGVGVGFFLAQLLFPFAYAYQDYYFYACGLFVVLALGLGMVGVWESRLAIWGRVVLLVLVPAVMLHTYVKGYYPHQMVVSDGGFSFTRAINNFTPKDSIIVVAGADWAAMVPYYADRRALLIRNGLEMDEAYVSRAIGDIADEEVSALVLLWSQRDNQWLRDRVTAAFGLESTPTFSNDRADIYINRRYGRKVRDELRNAGYYGDLEVTTPAQDPPADGQVFRISPGLARTNLEMISPAPLLGRFTYGYGKMSDNEGTVINAHPDADLWLKPSSAASRIHWEFGMFDSSWSKDGPKTDGVIMTITGMLPDGRKRVLFERRLDPVNRPEDRGRQKVDVPYAPEPGEFLHFSNRRGASLSYDWSYWAAIVVK